MSEPARWYDYVFLTTFLVIWLGALLFGERFLRLSLRMRLAVSLACFFMMLGWVLIHRL